MRLTIINLIIIEVIIIELFLIWSYNLRLEHLRQVIPFL